MIKRIALNHSASFTGAPVLACPERASDRLLVWVWKPGAETGGAAFIDACLAEGWNVLEIGCATSDTSMTCVDIVRAVTEARKRAAGAILFVADRNSASAVGQSIILGNKERLITGRCGLVTIDAFADDGFPPICEALAQLDNLIMIWAVRRGEHRAREATLRHHTMLQARGRETHFLVVPDSARSLTQQIADSRDPLGRETRWLLDPVHSRSS